MYGNEERENYVSDQERDFTSTVENLTDRELSRLRVVCNEDFNLDIPDISNNHFKEKILKNKYNKGIASCLEFILKEDLMPEKYFFWLKGNLRAQIFTLIYMRKIIISTIGSINEDRKNNGDSYLHPPSYGKITLNANGDIIGQVQDLFDNYKTGLEPELITEDRKIGYMEKLRVLWSTIYDKCGYNDWLEQDSEKRIKWAKNYLKGKKHYVNNVYGTFSDQQYKAVLLASLDLIEFKSGVLKRSEYQESVTKNKFMDRMTRSWAQKEFRDSGKAKTLHHFALTKNTKERLDEMVEDNDEKQVDLLSRLINEEYETHHLDRNGQKKYR